MRYHVGETITLPVPQGSGGVDAVALLWGTVAGDTLTAQAQDGAATFTATETANLLPGRYLVHWRLETGNVVRIVEAPAIVVLAVADGQPPTPTDAESRLEAAERLLATASGSAELSLSTADGTSMAFETRGDLLAYVARLRDEVAVERAANRLGVASE